MSRARKALFWEKWALKDRRFKRPSKATRRRIGRGIRQGLLKRQVYRVYAP